MASPSFRANSKGGGTASSFTATEPTGAADSDFEFMVLTVPSNANDSGPTITPPSGWTELTACTRDNWVETHFYYRVRAGAGSLGWTFSGSSAYGWIMGAYQRAGTGTLTVDTAFAFEGNNGLPGAPPWFSMANAAHSAANADNLYILTAMLEQHPAGSTLGLWSSSNTTFRDSQEMGSVKESLSLYDVAFSAAGSHGGFAFTSANDQSVTSDRGSVTVIIYEATSTPAFFGGQLPIPVRARPLAVRHLGDYEQQLEPTQQAEAIQQAKWFRQASEPVRMRAVPVRTGDYEQQLEPTQRPETIEQTKWYRQASEPVRVRPVATRVGENELSLAQLFLTYPQVVIADGPIAYYRLGEPSGTTMSDSSGNARHGTYSNGPTLGVRGALDNDTDTGIRLSGGAQGVTPTLTGLLTAPFSVEAWFWKPYVISGYDRIAWRSWVANGWILGYYANAIQFALGDSGGGQHSAGSANQAAWDAIKPGWHHAVGTYDGTTVSLYIDGVLHAWTGYAGWTPDTTTTAATGSTQVQTHDVDEVALYGKCLTPTQVLTHYNTGIQSYITVGGWWRQSSEPTFARAVPVRQGAFALELESQRQQVASSLAWWRQASEPVRVRPPTIWRLGDYEQQLEPTQQPEVIQVSKWYVQPSEPVRVKEPTIWRTGQSVLQLTHSQQYAPADMAWWRPPSEPVRVRPPTTWRTGYSALQLDQAQQYGRSDLAWWRPASEPVRLRAVPVRQGISALQLTAAQQPETIEVTKWFRQASEPVRVRAVPARTGLFWYDWFFVVRSLRVPPRAITKGGRVTFTRTEGGRVIMGEVARGARVEFTKTQGARISPTTTVTDV